MNHPRHPLGFLPTPLHDLPRLSRALGGPRLLIKRDDCSGLGLGGNKVRKLEFLIGDALARGCDTVITGGAAQSNHCRQTAAAAAICGLKCHLMLGGEPPAVAANGNLLLDSLFGASIHWCGEARKGERIPALAAELQARGENPYVIPYGGSNAVGALGFVAAVDELAAQLDALGVAATQIVFASSSGGTHAGLMVGKARRKLECELIGIAIDKGEAGELPFAEHVAGLAERTTDALSSGMVFSAADVVLDDAYAGAGYGVVGALERRAIRLLAESEGILLDPVYSGRAFGALIDRIERRHFKSSDTIVFWHTGGAPALFAYAAELSGREWIPVDRN